MNVKFTVNSSSDVADAIPGDGICDTVVGEPRICGLRAAIMESNALNGPNDVNFSAANTVLGTPLPAIIEQINIDASENPDGFSIFTGGLAPGSAGLTLALGSSDSTIRGIDIDSARADALLICGGARHTIGGDPDEGVAPNGQGNIFRGSGANGILVRGGGPGACASALGSLGGHNIWGNRIGTSPLGTEVTAGTQGNGASGINVLGEASNG